MTMGTSGRRLAIALAVATVILGSLFVDMKTGFSSSPGVNIDLFSNKEQYNGRGHNMPSDAFGPEENVVLNALVTCNDSPVEDLLVAFNVQLPTSTSFGLTARTGPEGIAKVNFTISTLPISISEKAVFGTWFTQASVLMHNENYQDTMRFKVDWVVKLLSVRAIDSDLTTQTSFGMLGEVGFEITLRSISMIVRSAVISIVMQDELDVPVNSTTIDDFQVQPNEKLVFLYCKLKIPEYAYIGRATVSVSAFTAPLDRLGVPYCPPVSTSFFILLVEPLTVGFHDVAVVGIIPSTTSVEAGQPLNVSVVAQNEGTEAEQFNLTARCDDLPFETSGNVTLSPHTHLALSFVLNTSVFEVGNHTLSALIPYLVGEADLTDNLFVDGSIEIRAKSPTYIHDIAIVDIKVSSTSVYVGEEVQVNVSVLNRGNGTETFNVEVHYNSSLIGTSQINAFGPYAQTLLVFAWNTSFVPEGLYHICTSAFLADDINVTDNTLCDGYVEVKSSPPPPPNMFHDVAVLNVYPSEYFAYIGDTVDVTVIVRNLGNYTESFNVTVLTDAITVETSLVQNLGPGSEKTLVYHWDTTHVLEGNYVVSALASYVPGDANYGNNRYVDGAVRVATAPGREPIPSWFYWFLLLLFLILLALLLLALWYRRRKRSEAEFYSGWTAWYYSYDAPSRRTKASVTTKRSRQRTTRR